MADTEHDIAACMLANALITNTGSRHLAGIEALLRIDGQPDAKGRALWRNVEALLRSPDPIPNYRGHFPDIPNPNAVHYERVQCFATGGAVSQGGGDDDDDNGKATKEQANYSPFGTEEKHCSICTMFREPHSCTEVQGDISRTAICDYFEGKGVHYERVPLKKRR